MTGAADLAALAPEHRLLLGLSAFDLDRPRRAALADLLTEHAATLDWGRFVDQAARHRVLPLAAFTLERYGLHRDAEGRVRVPYWWLFEGSVRANRERNLVLAGEYRRVLLALNDAGVAYAVRKGAALGERLYPDPALRITRDLDLLLDPDHRDRAADALTGLGYVQGKPSADQSTVEPFSRQAHVLWRTHLVNEPPFQRKAGHAGTDWFVVDFTTSLLHSAGRRTDVAALLAEAPQARLHGERARVLPWPEWLVNLAVAVYEEAVSLHHIQRGKDLRLQKFADLAAIGRAGDDARWQRFGDLAGELEVRDETYFALFHTDLLFPGTVPPAVLDALRPDDTGYLSEFGHLDRVPQRWTGSFLERLFDPARVRQSTGRSRVPTG